MKKTTTYLSSLGLLLFVQISNAQMTSSADIVAGKDAIIFISGNLKNEGNLLVSGNLFVAGDIENNNKLAVDGQLLLNGSGVQEIKGNSSIKVNELNTIQTGVSTIRLSNGLMVSKLSLSNGIIESFSDNPLILMENAVVTGASNQSHVKGYAKKIGNEAFVFPVGDGSTLREFSVSKPSANDEITVGFVSQNPTRLSNILSNGLQSITSPSYWSVESALSGQPIGIALRGNDADGQIVSFKNNAWEATKTANRSGVLSSTVTLSGVNYFTVGIKAASVEASEEAVLRVYPNPSTGSFEIALVGFADNEHISLDVVDMTGKVLTNQSGKVSEFNTKYSLGNEVVDGSYIVRVLRTEKQQSLSQKLIIRR
jgi:Secretion system C-terminal sorting domain